MNLEFYRENGYWIEPDVFTSAECNYLVNAASMLDNSQNGSFRPQMMPHKHDAKFMWALKHQIIISNIEQAVGGIASGLQTEFFYCKPGTKGFSLHQDNFFVQAPAGAFASAWIALTDTTPAKGGLIIYPGTHKLGLLPVRDLESKEDVGQDPNANKTECIVPEGYAQCDLSIPKGAAVIIEGHLVHGSHSNTTHEWRYVLLNTYIRKGTSFRPGKYAQREAIDL